MPYLEQAAHLAQVKRSAATHQDRIGAYRAANRCRQAWYKATGRFGVAVDWNAWRKAWYGSCFNCGVTPAEGVDHIISIPQGGLNVAENLQPACYPCNKGKFYRRNG